MSFHRALALLVPLLVLAASATASEPISGRGDLQAKDMAASTLQISHRIYHVTPQTVMRDADGNAVNLRSIGEASGPIPHYSARFQALQTPTGFDLTTVQLVETPQ
jgi:hypothetical protein